MALRVCTRFFGGFEFGLGLGFGFGFGFGIGFGFGWGLGIGCGFGFGLVVLVGVGNVLAWMKMFFHVCGRSGTGEVREHSPPWGVAASLPDTLSDAKSVKAAAARADEVDVDDNDDEDDDDDDDDDDGDLCAHGDPTYPPSADDIGDGNDAGGGLAIRWGV
jgi:hypothetical protein